MTTKQIFLLFSILCSSALFAKSGCPIRLVNCNDIDLSISGNFDDGRTIEPFTLTARTHNYRLNTKKNNACGGGASLLVRDNNGEIVFQGHIKYHDNVLFNCTTMTKGYTFDNDIIPYYNH